MGDYHFQQLTRPVCVTTSRLLRQPRTWRNNKAEAGLNIACELSQNWGSMEYNLLTIERYDSNLYKLSMELAQIIGLIGHTFLVVPILVHIAIETKVLF